MDLGALKFVAYGGGEWVIHLLILCSIVVVAIVVDRLVVQSREQKVFKVLKEEVAQAINAGDFSEALGLAEKHVGSSTNIVKAGLQRVSDGLAAVEENIAASKVLERQVLEKRLLILGTLGNNAPFIGLFGTVLGVIKAFYDLAQSAGAGPEIVMQGLSEALIATAVGLMVAIPAVMAYNYFQKRVDDILGQTDALTHILMAKLKTAKE